MNIAHRIVEAAKRFPDKKAVAFSDRKFNGTYQYPSYTFRQFEERSNQLANKLYHSGIRPGMRTLLFVKPCLDFSIITFALFKIGAVPVLIDPGMGFKNLLSSIRQVRPEAMVSIGLVHWIRRFKLSAFSSVKVKISLHHVGGRVHNLYKNLNQEPITFPIANVTPNDQSAILFTSGGTGIPKGVIYTHGILNAQTDALQKMFALDSDQIDLPGFPLFALFTLAMGMTSVIPDMDPTRPAACHPERIVQNIIDNNVTFAAGSPSIWERVGHYCLNHQIKLPSLKQVVMFGAPVRSEIHRMFKQILVNGDTYTPYGATEGLPVSLISGSDVLMGKSALTDAGAGTCVGLPVAGVDLNIIKASDIPVTDFFPLERGCPGEIIVSGPQITSAYFDMPAENQKAKIVAQGKLWHRMGDIGYIDEKNQLWFLGRKAHQVVVNENTIHYPIQVEAIFNLHPAIKRTALIKLSQNQVTIPALAIERRDGKTQMTDDFKLQLLALAKGSHYTSMIKDFFLCPSFPVDVRHNIKIDRVKLSEWAQEKHS